MKQRRWRLSLVILAVLAGALAVTSSALKNSASASASAPARRAQAQSTTVPPIKHVFIIVLENESEAVSFGAGSPAPYLARTLPSEGAFLPNYDGIGHSSLDNYIAMIGGQPPNPTTQADCGTFENLSTTTTSSYGAVNGTGCVYPAATPTIAGQLTSAGLTWGGYMDGMGTDPARESSTCAHPALGSADDTEAAETAAPYDQYATRHDPFMYYHSIIDDQASCDSHVVNLDRLPAALASVATTPNYTFITPDLCDDGHNTSPNCAPGEPGGLTQANTFLQHWVPQITSSPAFKQDGLLLVTFDEGVGDDSACCGELAGPAAASPGGGGPGGGQVGAVLLSPFIKPGTVSETAYNHYSMLGSIENLFGLPHLGYAQLPNETDFGSDVYTNAAVRLPVSKLTSPALACTVSATAKITLRFGAAAFNGATVRSYDVQALDRSAAHASWRTLAAATPRSSLPFTGTPGHTYAFRVAATDSRGEIGPFATSTTVIPTGTEPAKGHYDTHWSTVTRRGAWLGRAIQSATAGATFSLRYVGGTVTVIGETMPAGGTLGVTLDGHRRTLGLHSAKRRVDQVLTTFTAPTGTHHLSLTVVRGTVAIEGYAIAARTS